MTSQDNVTSKEDTRQDIVTERNRVRRLMKRREGRIRTCPVCGAVFGAGRSDTKYCSNACKQKHFRTNDGN